MDDELLELATKRLKQCDEYSLTIANAWTGEYRVLSEDQKIFANKSIDDVLFEARMGTLHRNSVKINQNVSRYENTQQLSAPTLRVHEAEYITHDLNVDIDSDESNIIDSSVLLPQRKYGESNFLKQTPECNVEYQFKTNERHVATQQYKSVTEFLQDPIYR